MQNPPGDLRPLGDWVAVQALPPEQRGSVIIQTFARGVKYNRGRVLRLGRLARGLEVGDVVWYEAHSAHPGQTWAIAAERFGGDEGADAFLLRAPRKAAPSSEADDVIHDRLSDQVSRLRKTWGHAEEKDIPKPVREQMAGYLKRLNQIEKERVGKRKSRRMGHTSDTARRQGIFAVEAPETDCSPEVDCFYRDNTPGSAT